MKAWYKSVPCVHPAGTTVYIGILQGQEVPPPVPKDDSK